jgi:hypothetical protein
LFSGCCVVTIGRDLTHSIWSAQVSAGCNAAISRVF